jgi:pimeloyl-ACP methyl ester carboxylesterase
MRSLSVALPLLTALALVPATSAAAADRCPKGMRCLSVTVPLDRSGAVPGTLDLPVVVTKGAGPVLLVLGGGPGQGMTQFAETFAPFLTDVAPGHRVAFVDQRGTGADGIDCRRMQRAALTDLTPPPRGSVEACGEQLGATRGLYTTADTVADLDAIRNALGVGTWAMMGTSYGTYVVERYARAHPDRVSRMVLDSVVPQENIPSPFFATSMGRTATVLRQLCAHGACRHMTRNAVGNLARLVRRVNRRPITGRVSLGTGDVPVRVDGPVLFDVTTSLASFQQELLTIFPGVVRDALGGRPKRLMRMVAAVSANSATTDVTSLSWGLHTATLCGDAAFPWGTAAADTATRASAVAAAVERLPARSILPFDRATAAGNGALVSCQRWQQTLVAPAPEPGPLPAVPTLILAGTWDLSTPIEDARHEATRSPTAQLVTVPEAGHSVLTSTPCAATVVRRFFQGAKLGRPCARNRAPRPHPGRRTG